MLPPFVHPPAAPDEEGATAVEYALIVGLVAGAIVFVVAALGLNVRALFLPLFSVF